VWALRQDDAMAEDSTSGKPTLPPRATASAVQSLVNDRHMAIGRRVGRWLILSGRAAKPRPPRVLRHRPGMVAVQKGVANQTARVRGCAAICASVFSPRSASKATRALNAAEWLRLGLLMDFPPVMPEQKSAHTRVRKTEVTSSLRAVCGEVL
jgi:hypothetical protein